MAGLGMNRAADRVVVLGSANADLIVRVERPPRVGETVIGADLVTLAGGKGANQAAAAGRLADDVLFVGCVGRDSLGDLVLKALDDAGVNTSRVARVAAPTGVAFITVGADGDNSIVVAPGANHCVGFAEVDGLADLLDERTILVLQLELPTTVVERAVSMASERGSRVLLNLAPATSVSAAALGNTDVLIVNETESEFLLGGRLPNEWAEVTEQLRRLGPTCVVVTIGPDGAVANDAGTVVQVGAPVVPVVDTTGAGDAFVGALAVRLASGETLFDAAEFAVRAASSTVQFRGAQPSYVGLSRLLPDDGATP
ncbi:MAG: ribokinase [Actinomycetes bacterium]